MDRITTTNDHRLITIAGAGGTGKTTLGRNLAGWFRTQKLTAREVSSGLVYRVFAILAIQAATAAKPAERFTATELVDMAKHQRAELRNGDMYLDERRVPSRALRTQQIDSLVSIWGMEAVTHAYASELIRRQIEAVHGYVIVDGRSVNAEFNGRLKLYLVAQASATAARQRTTVTKVQARDTADTMALGLPPEPDGITIDTTSLSRRQTLQRALPYVKAALLQPRHS